MFGVSKHSTGWLRPADKGALGGLELAHTCLTEVARALAIFSKLTACSGRMLRVCLRAEPALTNYVMLLTSLFDTLVFPKVVLLPFRS